MITIFKKSKKEKQKEEKGKKEEKEKPTKKASSVLPKREKKYYESWRVIENPIISEKATFLEEENKYVFKVAKKTNKIEIKKAIESLYGVKVKKVSIVNVKRKKRRLGRVEGYKPGYKKAIVSLEKGNKIEVVAK